jgi:hypothetical protein
MDAQTKAPASAGQTPVDGFDPVVEIKTQAAPLKSVKPADSSWNHCDILNDYKNTQEG